MYGFMFGLVVVALFVFSNNLLMMIGWDFSGPQGGVFMSMHPATYALLLMIGLAVLIPSHKQIARESSARNLYFPLLIASLMSLSLVVYLDRRTTGAISISIVTYITAAMLLYNMRFLESSGATQIFIMRFVRAFFIVNSVVGIIEYITGWRLLVYYAGAEIVTFDSRPTAILGHPLNNAMLTTFWLIILVSVQINTRLSALRIAEIVLLSASVPSFGGRASSVFGLAVIVMYLFRHSGLVFPTLFSKAIRVYLVVLGGAVALFAMVSLGFMDTLFDRFDNANKSTQTRVSIIQLLDLMTPSEWLQGVDANARNVYLTALETPYGIESGPAALVFAYGVPIAICLLLAVYVVLYRMAARSGPGARYAVLFFIITTVTSLSIGSKTLLLSQTICVLMAAQVMSESARRKVNISYNHGPQAPLRTSRGVEAN